MNMKYIIAVDLGGTITKVGLLRNGELVDYVKMPSRQDLDMTASLPEIENAIDFLLNSNGVKRLFGVGIAFPGLVNNKKSIIISTNEKYAFETSNTIFILFFRFISPPPVVLFLSIHKRFIK